MRGLTAAGIMEAYGRGRDAPALERPLALLQAALPDTSPQELAGLSLGARDGLLMELRRRTFGPSLSSVASCSECNARLDFELDVGSLLEQEEPAAGGSAQALTVAGFRVRFRLPGSRDVAAAAAAASQDAGVRMLLQRCVIAASEGSRTVAAGELPEEVVDALSERMSELDPLADVPVDLDCGACATRNRIYLDIGAFFWAEVAALAERLMYDVAHLARFYGWSESEILAMGPARRRYYLEMASPR